MAITYDALGATVSIIPNGTVSPGQLNTAVAIVGGFDSGNADSNTTPGEATVVNTGSEADTAFGENSELAYQARLAFGNGATAVHGVPLSETSTTESFSSTQSGTLGNAPAMDPNIHPDEDLTAQDTSAGTSVDVTIVYVGQSSMSPGTDEITVNPKTGEWKADSSSSYDISYTYGDYTTAIEAAATQTVRAVVVCTESATHRTKLESELSAQAANFRFKRGYVGADVNIQSSDAGTYSPGTNSWRLVEVAPARGSNINGEVRTVGAVAGLAASQAVNVEGSIWYDTVGGLSDLNVKYAPTTAENFSEVTAITDQYEIAQGVTTSSEAAFAEIYKCEIIDYIVEQLYKRIKNYRGGSNAQPAQKRFKSRLKRALAAYSVPQASPPLLASGDGSQPYSVTVSTGETDTEADVDIGIDVAPIAQEVKLDVSVGPIQFNGASV